MTFTPRCAWAANGKVTLVKSFAAASTLAPSGRPAATFAISCETDAPTATRSAGTPMSAPNPALVRATGSSKSVGRASPRRHRSTASATASATCDGGMPILGVFR